MCFGSADTELHADTSDFICISNFYRVPSVIDELGNFRLAIADIEDWCFDVSVQFVHICTRFPIARANDDLRWFEIVFDRRGFAQELRVVDKFNRAIEDFVPKFGAENGLNQSSNRARTDGRSVCDG